MFSWFNTVPQDGPDRQRKCESERFRVAAGKFSGPQRLRISFPNGSVPSSQLDPYSPNGSQAQAQRLAPPSAPPHPLIHLSLATTAKTCVFFCSSVRSSSNFINPPL